VCGVSYVKTSESQQLNVDHIFEKLPPLVFQGSTGCNLLEDYEDMLRDTFFSLIHDCEENPLLVTLLDVEDDILMREYLNFPERRFELAQGKFWIVKSFEDLWHFFTDRIFVCIHLLYDDKVFIKKPLIGKITKNEVTISTKTIINIRSHNFCMKATFKSDFFVERVSVGRRPSSRPSLMIILIAILK
jgi:hypothetical protein